MSKYTDAYLEENNRRGLGMGITIITYLNFFLKGKQKYYSTKYANNILKDIKKRLAAETVFIFPSIGNSVAYYPKTMLTRKNDKMRYTLYKMKKEELE